VRQRSGRASPIGPGARQNLAPETTEGLFLGDYTGLASAGADFLPLYARTVSPANRTDIFFARVFGAAKRAAAQGAQAMPAIDRGADFGRRVAENLARARKGHDARRRMNRDAADILDPDFHFAGMEARARWQTDLCGRCFEVQRAADRPTRTIEGGQDAVSSRLHQVPSIFFDHPARHPIVLIEQVMP